MVELTFYGGVNEIGGNKILLEEDEKSLFLDFGFPYGQHKQYYEEFLKPRGGAGLLDPLELGLIPPLEGIYRPDLEIPGLWNWFKDRALYRRLDRVDGVLLTHAHLDHSGHIAFLKQEIPIFTTGMTALIAKAVQDSGVASFDQQVCYYSPTKLDTPAGFKQPALMSLREAKTQRQFCLCDIDPAELTNPAREFWAGSFWEKGARQKGINSCELAGRSRCSFNLKCWPVDHSILGASAWAIETGAGWIVYSGDLRLHGKRSDLTRRFIREAARLRPKALIIEGTNLRKTANVTENEVYLKALEAVRSARGLVFADFSAKDVDRLLTFLQIARETGRKLAVLAKDAFLLKTVRLLDPDIPDLAADGDICVYQETAAGSLTWQRNLFQDYEAKTVLAEDVRSEPHRFILCFSFFDINELPSIRPGRGSAYIYSSSEAHGEEQILDFQRLHAWLDHFGIVHWGLPEERAGSWEIPEEQKGLHASGHACGSDLIQIVKEIQPETLIPVHGETPELYLEMLKGEKTNVRLPDPGGSLRIDPA
jgi:ribonuclease J